MKRCNACQEEKPFESFYPLRRGVQGTKPSDYHSYCKPCDLEYQKSAAYKRKSKLRLYYGLTIEDVSRMLSDQNGVCAICKKGNDKTLCVDHIHNEAKTVRGLLCSNCNRALGYFKDSPEVLANALQYLIAKGHA